MQHEIYSSGACEPFSLDMKALMEQPAHISGKHELCRLGNQSVLTKASKAATALGGVQLPQS